MFRLIVLSIFTLLATLSFTALATAQFPIPGQVVDVIDGKTVLIALPSGKVKVELQYIEVPETGQELHDIAREHLRSLVIDKFVDYRPKTILFDRAIGRLTVKNIDMSEQMLRDGAAWLAPAENSGQRQAEYDAYAAVETAAKNEKIGVWSIPGLKPAWEYRTQNREIAKQKEENWTNAGYEPRSSANIAARRKAVSNPAFADVGALLNRWDPETRTGLLSTTFLPLEVDKNFPEMEGMALDITYYYKEMPNGKRNGTYVFSVFFRSRSPQLLTNNNLIVWDNGKSTNIGKPKRVVSKQVFGIGETLIYKLNRSILERAANNEGVYLKIGEHVIWLTGGRYLLYNMLQVTQ